MQRAVAAGGNSVSRKHPQMRSRVSRRVSPVSRGDNLAANNRSPGSNLASSRRASLQTANNLDNNLANNPAGNNQASNPAASSPGNNPAASHRSNLQAASNLANSNPAVSNLAASNLEAKHPNVAAA